MNRRKSSAQTTAVLLALCLTSTYAVANVLTVLRVHSGDLIEFVGGWTTRLTGVAAPAADTPIGRQAHDLTKRLLEGKRVKVFTYTTDNTAAGIVRDAGGRPFARILFGAEFSTDLNELLLEKGFARVDEAYLPEDLQYYHQIEAEARANRVGIWAQSD